MKIKYLAYCLCIITILASQLTHENNVHSFETIQEKNVEDGTLILEKQAFYNAILSTFNSEYPKKGYGVGIEFLNNLRWEVKTNNNNYFIGEPIGFKINLVNNSKTQVTVLKNYLPRGFILNSIELNRIFGSTKVKVHMTECGSRMYQQFDIYHKIGRSFGVYHLNQGEKSPTYSTVETLNRYYDLSEPGEYELTFYTRNFLGEGDEQIGEYPKPCTIRFTIEDKKNWLDDHVEWPAEDEAPATPNALSTPSE